MQVTYEPIPASDAIRLRKWLDDSAFDIFVRLVESEVLAHEAAAAEHLMKQTEGGDKVANADVVEAAKCKHVLTLMNKFRDEKSFKHAKAIPTSLNK